MDRVRCENDFRIGLGSELVTGARQFAAQTVVIVDLSVVDERQTPVGVSHRLLATLDVDDTQATMGNAPATVVGKHDCALVGPSVQKPVAHAIQPGPLDGRAPSKFTYIATHDLS